MAAISPGQPFAQLSGPPRKPKKPTATTSAHRFEPFSKRISKLKIDPVHRVERNQIIDEDAGLSKSYFRASLDHWIEFNFSQDFTDFSRRANRLSESLPQLLHHADTIMDLMLEYIAKRDALSMEPLLSLLAHFAHDLGQNFEKYFSQAVTLVASVAANHEAPEVIEWSFTCLAWMFKFLSRLLVPDLVPLLGIVTPYLGKLRQKAFVTRFAAESIAYLIRKAAATYPKRKEPLDKALNYLFDALAGIPGDREKASYQAGLMTLLLEAIKGVDNGLHSSGVYLFSAIIQYTTDHQGLYELHQQVLEGLVIALIHQTDADGFKPILDIVLNLASNISIDCQVGQATSITRLLLLVVGTRKGSRVKEWTTANRALLHLVQALPKPEVTSQSLSRDIRVTLAMAMQYSPMNEILPYIIPFTNFLTRRLPSYFLPFCALFANIGVERFRTFLLPHFQQFLVRNWQANQIPLCLLLDDLRGNDSISPFIGRDGYIACPLDWERYIIDQFSNHFSGSSEIVHFPIDAYARLVQDIDFPKDSSNGQILTQTLHNALVKVLKQPLATLDAGSRFALGQGFKTYVHLAKRLDSIDQEIWPMICSSPTDYFGLRLFLDATIDYVDAGARLLSLTDSQSHKLRSRLIENLLAQSNEIKSASLKILQRLADSTDEWAHEVISVALEIQSTTYSLQNMRQISMHIRRLSILQKEGSSHANLSKLIPYFALGLLSTYHGSMVQTVCSCLAEICERPEDEETIAEIAVSWLYEQNKIGANHFENNVSEEIPARLTPFQCSNMLRIEALAESIFKTYEDVGSRSLEKFEQNHKIESERFPPAGRSLALQILKARPQIAEKRSRLIIPIFLAAQPTHEYVTTAIDSGASTSSHTLSPEIKEGDWSLSDLKAFLELFGNFTNPKALYRSAEVYGSLLELLTKGNSEIQKLALKAIMTWKQPNLRLYEENLTRLLDEKTFRDELTSLFHADEDHSSIEVAHRPEVLPVLLRLLYGQMVNRPGPRSNHGGQESKRKATLRVLFRLEDQEISQFLNIAFGPLAETRIVEEKHIHDHLFSYNLVAFDQQLGLLKMVESVMEIMRNQLSSLGETIIQPVLYCTIRACRHLNEMGNDSENSAPQSQISLARNIRRVGIHCLELMFKSCENIRWPLYLPVIFTEVITPRLSKFAIETAQGVSGLLKLFSAWASSRSQVGFLQDYNESILYVIGECLTILSAKDEVKIFVLDEIISKIALLAAEDTTLDSKPRRILRSHTQTLLIQLGALLVTKPGRKVLDSTIATLSQMTPFVESSSETMSLLDSLILVLSSPTDRVSPKVKGNLLKAMRDLLNLHHGQIRAPLRDKIYQLVASLFNYFKDTYNRATLTEILNIFALDDIRLVDVAQICHGLNAQSSARLDEIDYDRCLAAFNSLNDLELPSMTALHWQPILFNLLYFSRAHENFAIRSNAIASLRRFIEKARQVEGDDWTYLLRDVVLPALRVGIREDSETIRSDHVSLFGLVVHHFSSSINLTDMTCLLAGNDEEASFFANILHIQQHRRLRALRRLVTEVERGAIHSSNICNFLLPLLEKFIFDPSEDEAAHNLRGQAIIAVGNLLEWTEWNQFKAILRRYRGYMDTKSQAEKDIIKLLGVAADALNRTAEQNATDSSNVESNPNEKASSLLCKSLPGADKVSHELIAYFIPSLARFIHHKDESQISVRIPAAVITVKLLKMLTQDQMAQLLPPVLLDLSYILRSRTQESRDMARNTLSTISVLLGPSSLAYILRELRTSLSRGYQLHVLSYTLHSILVATAPHISAGDLDYCMTDLVSVVMDDVFGTVGQEKDSEDYVSKMKEVKSSKSFDSMELLAKSATIRHLIDLVRPLQTLLTGNISSKQSRQVDDLLRRIGTGLIRNAAAGSRDLLTFSYEIIQEIYNQKTSVPKPMTNDEINRERFLVQLSAVGKVSGGTSSPFLYKLVRFALDILRSTLQKHDNLLTNENLHGFLPVIGDALMEAQDEVKISALRLLSTIIRLPMSELDENAAIYLIEAVKVVRDSVNTNSEASQASLKLVTAILRERRSVSIRESDLSYLLHRITPDIEAPDKQGVTFNFIKAIMARRIVLPEVYELLDKIGIMMVTNHTQSARDVARGVYVHFLLEYPQSKSRWSKQVKFLVKNLEYQHPEGRQSVMEAVHLLLVKTGAEIAQEIVCAFSVPVIVLMANDDHASCREMAAALLSQVFKTADEEQRRSLLRVLRSWIQQKDNPALIKTGMQAYKIYFEVPGIINADKEVHLVVTCIYETLKMHRIENDEGDWESIYHALRLFSKVASEFQAATMTQGYKTLWSHICSLLSHTHPWIQNSAANLIGVWFQDLGKCNAESGLETLPVAGNFGLQLDGERMITMTRLSLNTIRRNWSNNDLSSNVLRNLIFIGRCVDANNLTIEVKRKLSQVPSEEADEESGSASDSGERSSLNGNNEIPVFEFILNQAASILRRDPPKLKSSAFAPKKSALKLLGALCQRTDAARLMPCLENILLPLHHLTDPSIPAPRTTDEEFQTTYGALVADAQELMQILQKKLGDIAYVKAMTDVAKTVRERREGRRTKRRIEAVVDPERFEEGKRRKHERTKVRRKEKGLEHRAKRRGW